MAIGANETKTFHGIVGVGQVGAAAYARDGAASCHAA